MKSLLSWLATAMLIVVISTVPLSAKSVFEDEITIDVTTLDKFHTEGFTVWVGGRVIRMEKVSITIDSPVQHVMFSANPDEEVAHKGEFTRFDVFVRDLSGECQFMLVLKVPGLTKGDKFVIRSIHYSPGVDHGFKRLKISKFAPIGRRTGTWEVIHEANNIRGDYSIHLNWGW